MYNVIRVVVWLNKEVLQRVALLFEYQAVFNEPTQFFLHTKQTRFDHLHRDAHLTAKNSHSNYISSCWTGFIGQRKIITTDLKQQNLRL